MKKKVEYVFMVVEFDEYNIWISYFCFILINLDKIRDFWILNVIWVNYNFLKDLFKCILIKLVLSVIRKIILFYYEVFFND